MQRASSSSGRQFGLDWLRIGAFGILIFYHIGMFFVPWGWHVKTADPIAWVQWPMMAVNPWRLSLLFVISGVVSRALMDKLAGPSAFAASRSWRLLVPLVAGMAIFVAPQPWAELSDQGTYQESFRHFWLHDYAEFGASRGTPLPTWNHLWFVAYLWTYSMGLAVLACLPRVTKDALQRGFDRVFGGWGLFVLPVGWIFAAKLVLAPVFGETHALLDDPYAHALYGFAFFFGFGLAKSWGSFAAVDRYWLMLLGVAVGACALMLALATLSQPDPMTHGLEVLARSVLAWTAILGLIGFARAHLHHDGPVRRYLSEAIFPFYIAHQTIIVVVGYGLKQTGLGAGVEFVGILVSTLAGCWLTYEIARRISWLRPVFGLKMAPLRSAAPSAAKPAANRPFLQTAAKAFLLGLPGVLALALFLEPPAGAPIAALLAGPTMLLAVAALAGGWATPRVGLTSSVLLGSAIKPAIVLSWLAVGIGLGLMVAMADHAAAALWVTGGLQTLREGRDLADLAIGMFYGGLTEEILLRWGLLSMLALGLVKLLPRRPALVIAACLATAAFAFAHVPAAALEAGTMSTPLLGRTLLWNGLLGAAFATAFLRHGLEAAILAHMGVHLGFALAAL
jgi:peptidoglycan/LPS O-acetylase OafA/YrhL